MDTEGRQENYTEIQGSNWIKCKIIGLDMHNYHCMVSEFIKQPYQVFSTGQLLCLTRFLFDYSVGIQTVPCDRSHTDTQFALPLPIG